jgi:hypothetical protein
MNNKHSSIGTLTLTHGPSGPPSSTTSPSLPILILIRLLPPTMSSPCRFICRTTSCTLPLAAWLSQVINPTSWGLLLFYTQQVSQSDVALITMCRLLDFVKFIVFAALLVSKCSYYLFFLFCLACTGCFPGGIVR